MSKKLLGVGVLATLCSGGLSAQSVLEEIIVTAQKKETSLQETPLAISHFDGGSIAEKGITDTMNLQSYIPNFNVGQEQDGFRIALRGVGTQGTTGVNDPGVAFYMDGLYIPRPSSGTATFFDIERIEVLRGPQGTLYGRNATGGVINVVAKKPVLNELEGLVGAGIGDRGQFETRGVLNLPLSEQWAARISAVYKEYDGYGENLYASRGPEENPNYDVAAGGYRFGPAVVAPGNNSKDFYGTDGDVSIRGQLLFDNGDDFTWLTSVTYEDLNGTGVPMAVLSGPTGGPTPVRIMYNFQLNQLGDPNYGAPAPTVNPELENLLQETDRTQYRADHPSHNDTDTVAISTSFTKSFGDIEAFLQLGYLSQETDFVQDFDGTEIPVAVFTKIGDNEARSLELRFSGSVGNIDWMAGAYHYKEENDIYREVNLEPIRSLGFPDFKLDELSESTTNAIFGNVDIALSDALTLNVGARITRDEKNGDKDNYETFAPEPPGGYNPALQLPGLQADWTEPTAKVGLNWQMSDDVMIYGSVANGYKAGGFNISSSGDPFDPETVLAMELGIKSRLLDNSLQVNANLFSYDYEDMQLSTLKDFNGTPGQLVSNATESDMLGLEVETIYQASDALRLTFNYAYMDAEFKDYINADPANPGLSDTLNPDTGILGQQLEGNKLPFTAEHTISLGIDYSLYMESGAELVFSLNSNWHDDMFMREYNDPVIDLKEAQTKTDFSLTYHSADQDISASFYVTNIEDEAELTNVYFTPGFFGELPTQQYAKDRSYGLRLDYSF